MNLEYLSPSDMWMCIGHLTRSVDCAGECLQDGADKLDADHHLSYTQDVGAMAEALIDVVESPEARALRIGVESADHPNRIRLLMAPWKVITAKDDSSCRQELNRLSAPATAAVEAEQLAAMETPDRDLGRRPVCSAADQTAGDNSAADASARSVVGERLVQVSSSAQPQPDVDVLVQTMISADNPSGVPSGAEGGVNCKASPVRINSRAEVIVSEIPPTENGSMDRVLIQQSTHSHSLVELKEAGGAADVNDGVIGTCTSPLNRIC